MQANVRWPFCLAAVLLLGHVPTHAEETAPPLDLIELLGDLEEDDTGWFEAVMTKVERKGQAAEAGKADSTREQEVKDAK